MFGTGAFRPGLYRDTSAKSPAKTADVRRRQSRPTASWGGSPARPGCRRSDWHRDWDWTRRGNPRCGAHNCDWAYKRRPVLSKDVLNHFTAHAACFYTAGSTGYQVSGPNLLRDSIRGFWPSYLLAPPTFTNGSSALGQRRAMVWLDTSRGSRSKSRPRFGGRIAAASIAFVRPGDFLFILLIMA